MTARHLIHESRQRSPSDRPGANGLVTLGWSQFWLLSSILGGILAMLALVLLASVLLA